MAGSLAYADAALTGTLPAAAVVAAAPIDASTATPHPARLVSWTQDTASDVGSLAWQLAKIDLQASERTLELLTKPLAWWDQADEQAKMQLRKMQPNEGGAPVVQSGWNYINEPPNPLAETGWLKPF